MTIEDAKRLYETIGEDESLRSEFEGLESEEEVTDKILEFADRRGIDVSRSDMEALFEELADETEQLDQHELKDVSGGHGVHCRNPGPFAGSTS